MSGRRGLQATTLDGASDERLLAMMGEGARAALAAFYRRYAAQVYGAALKASGGQEPLAEEATLRVFESVWNESMRWAGSHLDLRVQLALQAREQVWSLLPQTSQALHPAQPSLAVLQQQVLAAVMEEGLDITQLSSRLGLNPTAVRELLRSAVAQAAQRVGPAQQMTAA